MQTMNWVAPSAMALLLVLGACSKGADSVSQPAPPPPPASAAPSTPTGEMTSAPAGDASAPVAPMQSPAQTPAAPEAVPADPMNAGPAGVSLTGTVKEKLDVAESKTMYVQLDTGTATVWVATKQIDVAAGDRVQVSDAMEMRNFASPSLGRTFDVLYMASEIEKLP